MKGLCFCRSRPYQRNGHRLNSAGKNERVCFLVLVPIWGLCLCHCFLVFRLTFVRNILAKTCLKYRASVFTGIQYSAVVLTIKVIQQTLSYLYFVLFHSL